MPAKPLVHVLDDDAAVRDSVRELLVASAFDVACYPDARTFLDTAATARPGCILLDLRMPDRSGLDVQARLGEHGHDKPVVFLSGHGDIDVAVQAMKQGAAGFLTKPVDAEALLANVREAIAQDRAQRAERNRRATVRARLALLSPREKQVLAHVVAGDANKVAARRLDISPKTVELHRAKLMTKLRAQSVADLVRIHLQAETDAAPPAAVNTS